MAPASEQVAAHFAIGVAMDRWSMSPTAPRPWRLRLVRPASITSGTLHTPASKSPMSPFANPGPAVTAATPVSPVASAQPSAASTAAPSCRVSMILMSSSRLASRNGRMWPPGRAKTVETPRARSVRAINAPPSLRPSASVRDRSAATSGMASQSIDRARQGARCRSADRMNALQDEPAPDVEVATPDMPGGLGTRALRNTVLILVVRVISRIIALVAVIIIGNYLDPTRFGEMQTAVTYVGLVGTVTDLGFSALYVREGARHTDQISRYWNNVASLKVIGAAVGLPLIFAALDFAGLRSLLWPAFAILVLSGYQLLLRNTLYAMQRLTFEIIEIVPETLVVFALVVIGVHIHADTGFFLWAYALSYAFACIYFATVLMVMGVLRPGLQLEPGLLFSWVRVAVPLGITFIITTVYFKVDVPILQRFRPYSEVGYYTFAYKPFESLLFIPFALRSVVFPVLSVYHRRSPDRVLPLSEKFFKALVILGWPITVGVFLLAPQFNSLFDTSGLYPGAEPALQILALAVVFMFADNTFAATLNAIDKQNVFAFVAMVGLVINVGVNLIVIPRYGYLGASWAVVVTEAALVVVGWIVLRAQLGTIRVVSASWKAIVAGLVMGVFVYVANPHQSRTLLFVVVIASALIYTAVLLALRI